MLLGYNTNGLAHHDPLQAIELLTSIGYRSVAITIDHHVLNPFASGLERQLAAVRRLLEKHQMRSVIETGARYLLDPLVKHEPTLVSALPGARARRVEFLSRAIDIAAGLQSDCVSLWSGVARDDASEDTLFDRLVPSLCEVIDYAARQGMAIGFEPEPGMAIDTMQRFAELEGRIAADNFRLTLDVGHLHCQGETPIAAHIRHWKERLVNVHIEDMRAGVHEHLMFGEGEIDFPTVIAALAAVDYRGPLHVELSRHSHDGRRAARQAFDFLSPLVPNA